MPRPTAAPQRQYHVHWPGIFAIGLTVFVGIGAINSQNNLMFLVFGIALSLIAVSGVISGGMLLRLRITRSPIALAHAGRPTTLNYVISNGARVLPAFALLIREREPRRARRKPLTRGILPAAVGAVPPRAAVRAAATVGPRARGVVPLTGIEVSSAFPLGVFRKSVRFDERAELIVAPATRPIAAAELASVLAGGRRGDAAARSRAGIGMDFYGLRDYVPGDSPKKLAWKAWARTDQMVVHQTADEPSRALRLVLAIDAADTHDACEHAISECASLALAASASGIDVDVSIAGRDLRIPVRGRNGSIDLLRALARLEITSPPAAAGQAPRHTPTQIVIASGPRGRALAPAGRLWGMPR